MPETPYADFVRFFSTLSPAQQELIYLRLRSTLEAALAVRVRQAAVRSQQSHFQPPAPIDAEKPLGDL